MASSVPTILLVEDSADDLELVELALEQCTVPHELVVARDGVEALERLSRAPRPPRLILLDLKLPKLGGLDVLRRIRGDAATRLVPVAILTTSTMEADKLAAYQLGANSYVRKPIAFADLVAALRQLTAYWLVLNEPA